MPFNKVPTASLALRELLELSSERAADRLSVQGAYEESSEYNIGVPDAIAGTIGMLKVFGFDDVIGTFEEKLNRGAELAAKEAKTLLMEEAKNMQLSDALTVLRGGDHAATDYFKERTRDKLRSRYQDLIKDKLENLDFYSKYQQFSSAYKLMPIKDKPNLDLEAHVVDLGLDALYQQMAKEEANIRENPAELGSALLGSFLKQP